MAARMRCTTQVCTVACGQVASIASGNPDSPSQHDEHVSHPSVGELRAHRRPELGALGGLRPDPQHVLDASTSTPTAMWAALLRTWPPSRTLTTMASR